MILHLIRHGESAWNAEGRIQGQLEVPLSPRGQRQAGALAKASELSKAQVVFASPQKRAMETAQPIAAALGVEIRQDARLMEINVGVFQGLVWDEIETRYPDEARQWQAQDPDFVVPGGESRRMLMERVRPAFDAIHATSFVEVVVVAHGGVLAAALKSLLRVPAECNPFSFYNASISRLAWGSQLKLLTLNGLEHLRAGGLDENDRTGNL